MSTATRAGPLSDIRAIEMGTMIAGPFCGQLMADHGAEVIKLEQPGVGDPMREWGKEKPHGKALFWQVLARNKLSATLNHVIGDWRLLGRFRRYGEFTGYPADVGGWRRDYEPRYFVDVEAAYTMNDTFTVVVGAQNLLDEYPQETVRGAQDGVGMLYPENSPYGFGGGFYYFRAVWDFN